MVIINYLSSIPNNFTGKIGRLHDYQFYKNKKLHRVFGPAYSGTHPRVIIAFCSIDLFLKKYYIDGSLKGLKVSNNFSNSKFIKNLNKSWLL